MAYSPAHGASTTGRPPAITPPYPVDPPQTGGGRRPDSSLTGTSAARPARPPAPRFTERREPYGRSAALPGTPPRRHLIGPDHAQPLVDHDQLTDGFEPCRTGGRRGYGSQGGRAPSDSVPSISRALTERNDGPPGRGTPPRRPTRLPANTESAQEQPKLAEATFRNRAITCSVRLDRRP